MMNQSINSPYIKQGERIDQLYWRGLKIIQQPQYFCMALDPILLADFTTVKPHDKVVDLGTGNGALPLLLWAKEPQAAFTGLEIMPNTADLAKRNVLFNNLAEHIRIVEGDIKEASLLLPKASFSLVVTNPPYAKKGSGRISPIPEVAAARTELHCTLEDVIRQAAALLNSDGRLAMVHRPDRLAEAIILMERYGVAPKRLRLVQPQQGKPPNMFLLEGVLHGKSGLQILPALILQENGAYRREVEAIFAKNLSPEGERL